MKLMEGLFVRTYCLHAKRTHWPLCDWAQMAKGTVGR